MNINKYHIKIEKELIDGSLIPIIGLNNVDFNMENEDCMSCIDQKNGIYIVYTVKSEKTISDLIREAYDCGYNRANQEIFCNGKR